MRATSVSFATNTLISLVAGGGIEPPTRGFSGGAAGRGGLAPPPNIRINEPFAPGVVRPRWGELRRDGGREVAVVSLRCHPGNQLLVAGEDSFVTCTAAAPAQLRKIAGRPPSPGLGIGIGMHRRHVAADHREQHQDDDDP
jgi:hypothetical protein